MNVFEVLFHFQHLDYLIRNRATGSPDELARRLGVCRRKALRLIAQLRDQGFPVAFDKANATYYYTEPVVVRFEVLVGKEALVKIHGGTQYFFSKKLEGAYFWHWGQASL